MLLVTCPACSSSNRVNPQKRSRCGKCKRDFTPTDLAKGRPEPPPARPSMPEDFELEMEDDEPDRCDDCGRKLDDEGLCPKCDA